MLIIKRTFEAVKVTTLEKIVRMLEGIMKNNKNLYSSKCISKKNIPITCKKKGTENS